MAKQKIKVVEVPFSKAIILPPKEGKCQTCAQEHAPELPHNAQSMYYQYSFYQKNNKWPTWIDAMAHCTDDMKKVWTEELTKKGVDVAGGKVNPSKGDQQCSK